MHIQNLKPLKYVTRQILKNTDTLYKDQNKEVLVTELNSDLLKDLFMLFAVMFRLRRQLTSINCERLRTWLESGNMVVVSGTGRAMKSVPNIAHCLINEAASSCSKQEAKVTQVMLETVSSVKP